MEDWADSILSTLEVNLEKFLTAVKRGRERLHERSQEISRRRRRPGRVSNETSPTPTSESFAFAGRQVRRCA